MPKVTIPPHVTPENVATIIIDTSCEQTRAAAPRMHVAHLRV
jgi:hypothetical protein